MLKQFGGSQIIPIFASPYGKGVVLNKVFSSVEVRLTNVSEKYFRQHFAERKRVSTFATPMRKSSSGRVTKSS